MKLHACLVMSPRDGRPKTFLILVLEFLLLFFLFVLRFFIQYTFRDLRRYKVGFALILRASAMKNTTIVEVIC